MAITDDRLEGELVGFSFQAADGTFAVARVRTSGREERTVVGPVGHVSVGQHLTLTGRWEEHPQYGRQFKAASVLVDDPRTLEGLRRYLASDAVRGLGATYAERVVARFGLDTLRVIEEEPQRLREVKGIGPKRLAEIVSHWEQDRANREVHAALRGYGVGQALSNRIVEKYGAQALAVVTRQPYRLAAEVTGIGFRTADAIARAQGVAPDDPARAEAALVHALGDAEGAGHCFLPEEALLRAAAGLDVPPGPAGGALERMVGLGALVRHPAADSTLRPVYLPRFERAEAFVARRLAEIAAGGAASRPADLAPSEAGLGIELNADQRRAVLMALGAGATVITGGPGTGKTTIVRVLLDAARRGQEQWLLAAPTGRAAQRLAESAGAEARTIHRLLEYNGRTGRFTRGCELPLDADGVLVDEASMVDLRLMASLVAAVPEGCRLVLVGDADQLPSVGAGRVLADVIASGALPVATLSEVYRQARESGITRNAWRVNGGQTPQSSEREGGPGDFFLVERDAPVEVQAALVEILDKRLRRHGFDPKDDVQVLTPMHNGPLGTTWLNGRLQALQNPHGERFARGEREFRVGDRVLQTRNDYDNDVFNGDVGRIAALDGSGMIIDFGGRSVALSGEKLDDIELAYAITIHKSQGSEYPAVVVVLHRSHRIMLRRNLLYTAITRARRFCCIVGDRWALRTAVETRGGDERWTRLADRLGVRGA